jgi:predicted lipid-binding transport protein (Tim44 family)
VATREVTATSSAPKRTGGADSGGGVGGSGLSAGHVAAIGLSAAAVVLGILVAAFLVFRRKRRQLRILPGATRGSFRSRRREDGPKDRTEASGRKKRGVELPAARYKPEPEELETGKVATSTAPSAKLSSVWGSWSPARPELPAPNTAVELTAQSRLIDQVEMAEQLLARQAQLQQRRERLLQLQQIDEEEERIRQQLTALHGSQSADKRVEMP